MGQIRKRAAWASTHVENPDVILIGSGIMSANLGAMLKRLDPSLRIQLYEVTEELAQESSHGWNNAGTGHAGMCELSYTPKREVDGIINIAKAVQIFEQFEHSKQFWSYAVANGMADSPKEFINPVPHISFVYDPEQVDFLKARHEAMSAHHFFREMVYTTDHATIANWTPLLVEGRNELSIAATRMDCGTDVNFGNLSRKLLTWLSHQPDCGIATNHRTVNLKKTNTGWNVYSEDLVSGKILKNFAKFVFVGAGGAVSNCFKSPALGRAEGSAASQSAASGWSVTTPKSSKDTRLKFMGQRSAPHPLWRCRIWIPGYLMIERLFSSGRSRRGPRNSCTKKAVGRICPVR